jgi:hypothetical protein
MILMFLASWRSTLIIAISIPLSKLKAILNDKEPAVVLASARSLFLLGGREEGYDFDYEVLIGERKAADGFVQSQMNGLKDSGESVRTTVAPYARLPRESWLRIATRKLERLWSQHVRTKNGAFGVRPWTRSPRGTTLHC